MLSIKDHLTAMKETFDLEKKTVEQVRAVLLAQVDKAEMHQNTIVEKTMIANLPAEWVRAASVPAENEQTILFFHGGGFHIFE